MSEQFSAFRPEETVFSIAHPMRGKVDNTNYFALLSVLFLILSFNNLKILIIALLFNFIYYLSKENQEAMNSKDEKYKRIHFAVMAIEGSAKKLNIPGHEMFNRLSKQDIIHSRLLKHYELLHTQSLEWVVDDTIETLDNWEKERKEIAI